MATEKLKLLLVDDELDICTYVQSYFGKRDFAVSTTGSALEALSMIKTARPDLVLLDIKLHDMTGASRPVREVSNMPFKFLRGRIADVVLIESTVLLDGRGLFVELFKASDFRANGLPTDFVQASFSRSAHNVLRGLHYQLIPL